MWLQDEAGKTINRLVFLSLSAGCLLWCHKRTDTVAHPGTVMVELCDAAVAHCTVFGPDGLPYLQVKDVIIM